MSEVNWLDQFRTYMNCAQFKKTIIGWCVYQRDWIRLSEHAVNLVAGLNVLVHTRIALSIELSTLKELLAFAKIHSLIATIHVYIHKHSS